MGKHTEIAWCDATFNGWRGCTKVSPGCKFCYADKRSIRNPKIFGIWGPDGSRVVASSSMWRQPHNWDREAKAVGKRLKVFSASLADVFEDWTGPMVLSDGDDLRSCPRCGRVATRPVIVSSYGPGKTTEDCTVCGAETRPYTMDDARSDLWQMILATSNLDWLVLTKRPDNMARWLAANVYGPADGGYRKTMGFGPRLAPNVWLGVSVEDQDRADERIPQLLAIPAAVRFLSIEPLLGPVDLRRWLPSSGVHKLIAGVSPAIGWVIVGGESGPDARPMHPDWVRAIRDQCQTAGVPFFMKQWGEWLPVDQEADRSEVGEGADYGKPRRALFPDGHHSPDLTGRGNNGDGAIVVSRCGKKIAGRWLDGRPWDQMPQP